MITNVNQAAIERAAERLLTATRTGQPCAPVRDLIGSTDVVAAYEVQKAVNDARIAEGATIVGRKIGLTSAAVQEQLGVDRPDFGVLFSNMGHRSGDTIPHQEMLQPRVEAEVAFMLAEDLDEAELTPQRVRRAVDYAVASLEIVDSRIDRWDITFGDTVADNGSAGRYVLGERHVSLDQFTPASCDMTLSVDGEVVSTGAGTACLGDPLEALLWLAQTAIEHGDPLVAGQVILTGALGPMVPATLGSEFVAEISGLGSVSCRFE